MNNYDRRSNIQRGQYEQLKYCYERCKGVEGCDLYTVLDNNNICVWYETLLNDKEKLKTGRQLTFPILEKILTSYNKDYTNKK